MGKSSKTKVGYHYRLAIHIGLLRGSIDAFVEFRAADKTAWHGELTASGRIQINAPDLFGGEKDQGGIVGPVDVMFGEEDQVPNAYLVGLGRNQTAAWRGFTTLVFAGGRYGAMSPFAQKPSFKVRKILRGWDGDFGDDPCWYPAKAPVLMSTGDLAFFAARTAGSAGKLLAGSTPFDMTTEIDTGLATVFRLKAGGGALFAFGTGSAARVSFDRGQTFQDVSGLPSDVNVRDLKFDGGVWLVSVESGLYAYRSTDGRTFAAVQLADSARSWYQVHARNGTWTIGSTNNLYARSTNGAVSFAIQAVTDSDHVGIFNSAGAAAQGVVPVPGGWLALGGTGYIGFSSSGTTHTYVRVSSPINAYTGAEAAAVVGDQVRMIKADKTAMADSIPGAISVIGDLPTPHNGMDNVALANGVVIVGTSNGAAVLLGDAWQLLPLPAFGGGYHVAALPTGAGAVIGMNAAHALYYCRTDESKGRQPRESMDEDNLTAAADRLFAEGFGLCWTYDPERDTPDSFDEQVCRIIDGGWARSLRDGKWRLHLNRADYDLGSLPVISDGDGDGPGLILSFRELPSTLDTAVNILGVRYFDVARKETITVWARAPGLVHQFGEIRQILEMPWVPNGTLAAQIAERELRSYITPKRSFEIATDPRYRFIDRYQTVRFQTPKRGIADMVCVVGEKEAGTLRSGAIRWVLTQHVTGFADVIIVEPEYGVDTRPSQVPVAIEDALVFEAPYIDVCATLPRAELEALPEDVGYLIGVAADPARHLDYTMMVQPDGGEYAAAATGDWCPTALVVEAATDDPEEIDFTLSDTSGLAAVQIGSPVVWGAEWCRVDDLDLDADPATIRLGRGCADTLAHEHDAGERLWFIGDRVAADVAEYTEGETVNVKMLSNTGSALFPLDDAAALPIELAGRQARPYPPARVLLNGEHRPPIVLGDLVVSWRHRDRVGQADQLFDQLVASIGPEPGTTYGIEYYTEYGTVPIDSEIDIAGTAATPWEAPVAGNYRVEVFSKIGALESWQRCVRVVMVDGALPWTPGNLPVPPKVWLDWDSPLTDVSGVASAWENSKGSAGGSFNQSTAGFRPAIDPSGPGGKRALVFDGTNDRLAASGGTLTQVTRNVSSAWIFAVARQNATGAGDKQIIEFAAGTSVTRLGLRGPSAGDGKWGGTVRRLDAVGAAVITDSSVHSDTSFHAGFLQLDFSSTTAILQTDGLAEVLNTSFLTAGSTSNTDSVRVNIGANGTDNAFGNVAVACILVGSANLLSLSDRQRLQGWAMWECGIQSNLPTNHPFRFVRPFVDTPVLQPSFASSPTVFGFVAAPESGDIGFAAGPAVASEFGALLLPAPTLAGGQGITTAFDGGTLTVRLDGITPAATPAEAVVIDHRGAEIDVIALTDGGGYYSGTGSAPLTDGNVYYVRVRSV